MEDLFAVLLGTTAVSAVGAAFSLIFSLRSLKQRGALAPGGGHPGETMVSLFSFLFLEVPLRV